MVGFDGAAGRMKRMAARAAHRRRTERARRADEAREAREVVDDPRDWEPARNDMAGVDDGRNADLEGPDRRPSKAERIASPDYPDYPNDSPGHGHDPSPDEGAAETATRLSGIAPVLGNPSLDPGNPSMVQVSYMCGFGSDARCGHDALDGVDRMVLGEADANYELEVGSATEGGPLELAPDESVFEGRAHDTYIGEDRMDYCAELECDPGEGWL